MHSVVLTELGIIVLDEDTVSESFAFSDNVGQYLAVKNKKGVPNSLIRYLQEAHKSFAISDESLLSILREQDLDAYLMDEDKIEHIDLIKQQLLVDAGFASKLDDALEKLRNFAISLSSAKVTQVSQSADLHIIQAINSLDEIDKIANILSSMLREWYGLHFPELDNLIDSINGYSQIVMAGKRTDLNRQVFEDAGFPEPKVEMLVLVCDKSKGGDISDANLVLVQGLAKQILQMHDLRKNLVTNIEEQMSSAAPNLSAILGSTVGARLLAKAGSLKKLASIPASRVQILGAEVALFRAIKTGSKFPKHGLLFHHPMVHSAPRWQRGKIARAVAAQAAIAARVDVYGDGINETLLARLNIRVDEIAKKYSEPVIREPENVDAKRHDFQDTRRNRDQKSSRRSTFEATCDKCGTNCQLPFRPNQDKPVYCDECFRNRPASGDRFKSGGNRYKNNNGSKGRSKPRKRFARR